MTATKLSARKARTVLPETTVQIDTLEADLRDLYALRLAGFEALIADGLTQVAVAEIAGCSSQVVAFQLHKARKRAAANGRS